MATKQEQRKRPQPDRPRLDWRDYVALTIALLQTNLLPFVLLLLVFIAMGIFLSTLQFR